ncbi:Rav1 protein [Martiniozyma asiatica (nom. inval.)]|nr:Rav1 protein [Martiniozyma asiatica]
MLYFLPGEPSLHVSCAVTTSWNGIQLSAYCSGNNLVLFTKNNSHLQTIYLPQDASSLDINTSNGKVAVVIDTDVLVYTPKLSNFYNFNFHGRKHISELHISWDYEITIHNDSPINCISWSDYSQISDAEQESIFMDLPMEFNSFTACEFVVGSDTALTLHRIFYSHLAGDREVKSKILWHQKQPSSVSLVKFSPNATCIASVGKYDRIIKLWHRISFNLDFNEFELRCIPQRNYVTSLFWKKFKCINENIASTSVSMTPSASFLKPSNGIIKNDHARQFRTVSESNSLHSTFGGLKHHNVLYIVSHGLMSIVSTFRTDKGFEYSDAGSIDLSSDTDERTFISILDEPFLELSCENLLKKIENTDLKVHETNTLVPPKLSITPLQRQLIDILSEHAELCIVITASGKVTFFLISNLSLTSATRAKITKLKTTTIADNCLPTNTSQTFMITPNMCYNAYLDEEPTMELTIALLDLNKKTIRLIGSSLDEILTSVKPFGNILRKYTGHNKSVQKMVKSSDGSAFLSVTRFNENCFWKPIALSNNGVTLSKKSIIKTGGPVEKGVILGDLILVVVNGILYCYDCHLSYIDKPICQLSTERNDPPVSMFVVPEKHQSNVIGIYSDHKCKAWNVTREKITPVPIGDLPLDNGKAAYMISEITPVGWLENIDHFGRDLLATIDEEGYVTIYYLSSTNYSWHIKEKFNSGIKNASNIAGSSMHKISISSSDAKTVCIWDTQLGTLDYEETFEQPIRDLDWTALHHGGILSIGFESHCFLYMQQRWDYTNATPIFKKVKEVSIYHETKHTIGDSIWLGNGLLVIAAGNQFYLSSDEFISEIVDNGPLPLFHPQFVIQLLLSGKYHIVEVILSRLCNQLRLVDLGEKQFDISLGLTSNDIQSLMKDDDIGRYDKLFFQDGFNKTLGDILIEKLIKFKMPHMSRHQQSTLVHTITIVVEVLEKYRKVLDVNGLRFFFVLKLFLINLSVDRTLTVRNRDIVFALHSDNKDLLLTIVKNECEKLGGLDWNNAKRFGLSIWVETAKLPLLMETIAKNEFNKFTNKQGGKDPSLVSIYYLALGRKQILIGLWKMAFGHPDREKMIKFLQHDFTEERWRKAAVKNAFVLLGKHRYRDAVTFFLLAGAIVDAVMVIIRQLEDPPLAIAVAKCYEKCSNGKAMILLLQRGIIPQAMERKDRWALSICFTLLGEHREAIKAFINPIELVIDSLKRCFPQLKIEKENHLLSKQHVEDPLLLTIYDWLRDDQLIDSQVEFQFVLKVVGMYGKLGCDWIALDLVRRWKFGFTKNINVGTARKRPGDLLAKFGRDERPSGLGYGGNGVSSVLDSFMDAPRGKAAAPSMLDSFMDVPKGKAAAPSMLDSFMDAQQGKAAAPSMLDSFMDVPKGKAAAPSMLDSFMDAQQGKAAAPSMLDSFTDAPTESAKPVKKKMPVTKPSNLLDQWS